MKTKTKRLSLATALLVVALALGLTHCRLAMSPLARSFGSPSEHELARCRVALQRLQQTAPALTLEVAPVMFVCARQVVWRRDLAETLSEHARAQKIATVAVARQAPAVKWRSMPHNQLRYLWARAHDYARWISTRPPHAQYMLCTEVWTHNGQVVGIHVFVYEAGGQLAYCRLFNSHHFGHHLTAEGSAAVDLAWNRFLADLRREPEKVFPPFGVGRHVRPPPAALQACSRA